MAKLLKYVATLFLISIVIFLLYDHTRLFFEFQELTNRVNSLSEQEKTRGGIDAKLPDYEACTVRIIDEYGEGSGFILNEDGYIVTNAHVVTKTLKPKVVYLGGGFAAANVVYHDPNKDIAIIKVDPGSAPSKCPPVTPQIDVISGSNVTFLGYPLGHSLPGPPSVGMGYVSAVRYADEYQANVYQIGAAINSGNSGGPVFNDRGQLVGIITATVGYFTGLGVVLPAGQVNMALAAAKDKPLEADTAYTEQLDLNTPVGAVEAFYFYQKVRRLQSAYELLSKNFVGEMDFAKWEEGYANTLNIYPLAITENKDKTVHVKLLSVDLVGEKFVTQY
ncbi:MAG: serine protease, partial [bacterium]|nr:serine protease [bacterium]